MDRAEHTRQDQTIGKTVSVVALRTTELPVAKAIIPVTSASVASKEKRREDSSAQPSQYA